MFFGVPLFKLYPLSESLIMHYSKKSLTLLFLGIAPICGKNSGITVPLVKNMIPNLRKSALKH